MKRRWMLLVVLLLLASASSAQVPGDTLWTNSYPGMAYVRDVAACSDSTYVIIGTATDLSVRKITSEGADIWTQQYSGQGSSEGTEVLVDSSGNIYAVGRTETSPDLLLVKYNSSGVQLWEQTYDSGESDVPLAAVFDLSRGPLREPPSRTGWRNLRMLRRCEGQVRSEQASRGPWRTTITS